MKSKFHNILYPRKKGKGGHLIEPIPEVQYIQNPSNGVM